MRCGTGSRAKYFFAWRGSRGLVHAVHAHDDLAQERGGGEFVEDAGKRGLAEFTVMARKDERDGLFLRKRGEFGLQFRFVRLSEALQGADEPVLVGSRSLRILRGARRRLVQILVVLIVLVLLDFTPPLARDEGPHKTVDEIGDEKHGGHPLVIEHR